VTLLTSPLDLEKFPLKEKQNRDPLSALLFLHYASQFDEGAKKRLGRLLNRPFPVLPSPPLTTDFFPESIQKKLKARKTAVYKTSGMLFGYSGQGLRLLQKKSPNPKDKAKIEALILELSKSAQKHPELGIYWVNHLYSPKKSSVAPIINLGITRGLVGPLLFLSLCHRLGYEKKTCLRLVSGAVDTILQIDKKTKAKGLPRFWPVHPDSGLTLAFPSSGYQYGDCLIGYALTLAGLRCGNKSWEKSGERIFLRGLKETPEKNSSPYLGSGSAGLSHLAFRYYQLKGSLVAAEASRCWLDQANESFDSSFQFKNVDYAELRKKFGGGIGNTGYLRANIFSTNLGLALVNWSHTGKIDCRWDSMFGFSNPVTGEIV
jgi:hypothetical protein